MPMRRGGHLCRSKARDVAAASVGVSHTLVSRAKRLHEQAPEVLAEVKSGAITLAQAERQVFPTAKEKAHADPAVKWSKALSDILMIIASVGSAGGMKRIAASWTDEKRRHFKKELTQTANKLLAFAEEL
jgi:hypothetical protein